MLQAASAICTLCVFVDKAVPALVCVMDSQVMAPAEGQHLARSQEQISWNRARHPQLVDHWGRPLRMPLALVQASAGNAWHGLLRSGVRLGRAKSQ
jgi:hypothetical protein